MDTSAINRAVSITEMLDPKCAHERMDRELPRRIWSSRLIAPAAYSLEAESAVPIAAAPLTLKSIPRAVGPATVSDPSIAESPATATSLPQRLTDVMKSSPFTPVLLNTESTPPRAASAETDIEEPHRTVSNTDTVATSSVCPPTRRLSLSTVAPATDRDEPRFCPAWIDSEPPITPEVHADRLRPVVTEPLTESVSPRLACSVADTELLITTDGITDTQVPAITVFPSTDMVDPALAALLIESELPSKTGPPADNRDPAWTAPRIEAALPTRTTEATESELDIATESMLVAGRPIRIDPPTDRRLPRRHVLRTDSELPRDADEEIEQVSP